MGNARQKPPIDARSTAAALKLRSDNVETDDYWILLDTERDFVTIGKQRTGLPAEWVHAIERKDFDKLVRWYVLGVMPRKPTARARRG